MAFMRVWAWIAIGVVVAALAVLIFPLVQLQKELRLTDEQVVQARGRIAELEEVVANLKTELDAANRARTQLQGGLEEANSEIEKRQSEVERLSAELEKATDLAKDAEAPVQEGDSASEPSDGWRPQ
jgi:chromosome segregation ATPase